MKFHWYDPYASVIGSAHPAFRDRDGKEVLDESAINGDGRQLLYVAAGAGRTLIKDASERPTRDEWDSLVREAANLLAQMKEGVQESVGRFNWQDPFGDAREAPDINDIDDWTGALVLHRTVLSASPTDAYRIEMSSVAIELWCVLCLYHIDSALLSLKFEDAGFGMYAAIKATEALANARALQEERPPPFRELARRGAEARHASTNEARAWVWSEWLKHSEAYGNNKTDFARTYVLLSAGQQTHLRVISGLRCEVA